MEERLKPKIKKRLKISILEEYLKGKVNYYEFKKQIDRVDNIVSVIQDKVDYRIPAMELEFNRELNKKANVEEVDEEMEKKADKNYVGQLIERLNKLEETTTALSQRYSKMQEDHDSADEIEGPESALVKADGAAGVGKEVIEKLQARIESVEKKL